MAEDHHLLFLITEADLAYLWYIALCNIKTVHMS